MENIDWSPARPTSLPPLQKGKDLLGERLLGKYTGNAPHYITQGVGANGRNALITDSNATLPTPDMSLYTSAQGSYEIAYNKKQITPTSSSSSASEIHAPHLTRNDFHLNSYLSTDLPHHAEQKSISLLSQFPQTASKSSVNYGQARPFTLPYFRLTDQEHKSLQKRSHQSSKYVFGNLRLVRELEDLGRGWSAFIRARNQAEQDGSLASFQLQLKAEIDETARLGAAYSKTPGAKQRLDEIDMPLPPNAVSMHAAEEGSQEIAKQGEKRKRWEASELMQLTMDSDNGMRENKVNESDQLTQSNGNLEASSGGEESDEDSVPPYEYRGRGRPRWSKNKVYYSRGPADGSPQPKRTQIRPDYTKTKIHEAIESSSVRTTETTILSSPTLRQIYDSLEPKMIEFPCEWKGCKATLINLATLKKHISVVHSKEARENLRCLWGKCGQLVTPVFFCKLSDVDSHIMERHMEEIAWKLGDGIGGVAGGPVVPDTSVNPPLKLFRKGPQVAATLKNQKFEFRAEVPTKQHRVTDVGGEMHNDEDETGLKS